jgi:hypothetical protein
MTELIAKRREILYQFSLNQSSNKTNIRVYFGQKIFKFGIDDETVEDSKAKIDININPKNKAKSLNVHIPYEPGFIYVPAINLNNAYKKFYKIIILAERIARVEIERERNSPASSLLKGEEKDSNIVDEVTNTD